MFSKFMNKMIFANLADFKEGKIDIMGVGAVILTAQTPSDVFLRVFKAAGKKAFDIFYEAGKDHGRLIGGTAAKHFGVSKEKFFSQMMDSCNMMGIGLLEVVKSDPSTGEAMIRLKNSTVAEEVLKLNGKTKFPVDWFFAGTIVGIYESAFKGRKFTCKETRCMATGAPCCEFVIKPA
jgi:predicted hydrocarbon binding protein